MPTFRIFSLTLVSFLSCQAPPEPATGQTRSANTMPLLSFVLVDQNTALFDALPAYLTWQDMARYRPGSTFIVQRYAGESTSADTPFFIQVPERWPAPILPSKQRFFATARKHLLNGGNSPLRLPPEAVIGQHPESIPTITVIHPENPIPSERWTAMVRDRTHTTPLFLSVIIDLSASSYRPDETELFLRNAYSRFLEHSHLVPGSCFRVTGTGTTRDSANQVYSKTLLSGPAEERVTSALDAYQDLRQLELLPEKNASAIAETIHRVYSEQTERPGTHELLILSDLRQTTPGIWSFESSIPSPEKFMTWLQDAQLDMDMNGCSLIAVGVHSRKKSSADQFTAADAIRIRNVWTRTWTAMGAKPEIYSTVENAFPRTVRQSNLKKEVPHENHPQYRRQ